MKTITLKNGIVIKDNRHLSCGVSIENQNTKYITLCYSTNMGFYLNIKGVWIKENDFDEYLSEFETMKQCLVELRKHRKEVID